MSGGKPVIGVGWPKPDYLAALTRADADPFVIGPDRDAISTVLDRCDGLLLTGGADVEPRRYGESIRYDNLKLDPTRDEYEIALIQAALARDVPILAICRGIQALNVAAGGTLVQDIPSEIATPISHKGDRPEAAPAHDVTIHAGTHAARLLEARLDGDGRVAVNSRHHQAVKNVAPGLVVSAVAPDGIVEGLEQPSATFCVAVQWHPENFWSTGEFAELFRGLVNAAGGRR